MASRKYSKLSTSEKILIVEAYYENNRCVTEAWRKFFSHFKLKRLNDGTSISHIHYIISHFKQFGSVDSAHSNKRCEKKEMKRELQSSYDEMNVISEHVTFCKLAFHSKASSSSYYKFLKSHLKLFPYKVTTDQVLTQSYKDKRLNFCQWFLGKVF